jgi:hypothetical protein
MYPVAVEPGNERTTYTYKSVSGLTAFCTVGSAVRGMTVVSNVLYVVSGNELNRVASDGTKTLVGNLLTSSGIVDFAANITQLVVTDGANLYVNLIGSSGLATVANYPGGDRLGFLDQYIVFNHTGTQRYGWSKLADASILDALDFASAEGAPDKIVSLLVSHRELMLLGEGSVEIHYSSGDNAVFTRNNSAFIEFGCVSAHAAQKSASSVIWLSQEDKGQGIVMQANGYQPQRISTAAIEERLQNIDLSGAYAYSYSEGASMFYVLQIPNAETTLVYDSAFKLWHERYEFQNDVRTPWRATCHSFADGKHYFGAADGIVYVSSPTVNKYGNDNICRERICPVMSAPSRKLLRFARLELLTETATDANVMLRWSDDNGANYSDWVMRRTGATGRYGQRVQWLRTGAGRDRVYHFRCTDDVPFNPVSALVDVQ